jgi:hypothetical protein
MHGSARAAKLQALLSDHSEVREQVGELTKTYENILAEDARGTRLAHMVGATRLTQRMDVAFDETRLLDSNLTDATLVLLAHFLNRKYRTSRYHTGGSLGSILSPKAKLLDKFSLRGVQYSTAGSRTRNSHVFFRPPQVDESEPLAHPEPGQITDIFLYSQFGTPEARGERRSHKPSIYLCIRPYVPLRSELSDVDKSYRQFGFAGGFLSERALGAPIVVDYSSIISHVAVTPMKIRGCEVLHVLPMDRVSYISPIEGNI